MLSEGGDAVRAWGVEVEVVSSYQQLILPQERIESLYHHRKCLIAVAWVVERNFRKWKERNMTSSALSFRSSARLRSSVLRCETSSHII